MGKTFSQGWVTLLMGFGTGLDVIVTHHDQVNTIIGASVTIVTAIIALAHDIELKKIEASKTALPPTEIPTTTVSATQPITATTTLTTGTPTPK